MEVSLKGASLYQDKFPINNCTGKDICIRHTIPTQVLMGNF